MAKRNARCQLIYEVLDPVIKELGFELLDVIYANEDGKLFLRLLVDKHGGINIDECELISETVDPIIEQELQLRNHDYFEVSSPGLERALTEAKEFDLYTGQLVEVRLYKKIDDKKIYTGELLAGTNENITILDDATNKEMNFDLKDVAKVARIISFD